MPCKNLLYRSPTSFVGYADGHTVAAQECMDIRQPLTALLFMVVCFLEPNLLRAQSLTPQTNQVSVESSSSNFATTSSTALAVTPSSSVDLAPPALYTPPTESQKLHNWASNAFGPAAIAGSAVGGAIDQAFNFPGKWGQGTDAYGARVASNLGISLVTATAQYSLAEVFHEDTAYYRCACKGFIPRFWHAAISTVSAPRESDGHRSFSIALTTSPFIGPLTAANTWIPTHDGPMLGFHMGAHNLLGQFGQNEALEFLYGGPHTLLGRIEHLFRKTQESTPQP